MTLDRFVDVISFIRQEIANRPFLLFLALLTLSAVVRVRRSGRPADSPSVAGYTLAIVAIGAYAAIAMWYVGQEQYADAAEPTIAAVAALFDAGRPVYHAIDSAERYAHIYGPLAFIIPGWCLSLLGGSIIGSKAPGAAAGLLSIAAMFALVHRTGERRRGLVLAGLFAALCLAFQHVSFWNRPDSYELLAASAAMLAAVRARGDGLAGVLLGVAAGVLVGLKMTGPVYALPAFAVLAAQSRMRAIGLAALTALIVAVLPFVLYDNVTFSNYLTWLRASARNGLQFSTLKQNVEWALFLLIPLVPSFVRHRDPVERWLHGSLAVGMALIALAASKPGAGPYHLLPFVPAVAYAVAVRSRPGGAAAPADGWHRSGVAGYATSCAVIAFLQMSYLVWSTTRTPGTALAADVRRVVAAHPSARIEMGYSAQNEAFSYVRPILVFHQREYLFDAPAIQEHQLSRVELPDASIRAVESCRATVWLIPRGGEPFSLRNRYPLTGQALLFPDSVRAAFRKAYVHTANTEFFDLWTCRDHVK
jgi:Dolichyl-phosphate-mannose-protein mannosyltransferase